MRPIDGTLLSLLAASMAVLPVACSSGESSSSATTGAPKATGAGGTSGAGGVGGQAGGGGAGDVVACFGLVFTGLCGEPANCGEPGESCGPFTCAVGSKCSSADLTCYCQQGYNPYTCEEKAIPHYGRFPMCDEKLQTCVGYNYGCAPSALYATCSQTLVGFAGYCKCSDPLSSPPLNAYFGCDTDPAATCDGLCAEMAGK